MHPLAKRVGSTTALRDHHTNKCIVVTRFLLSLFNPFRELEHLPGGLVLTLQDDALAVQPNSRDIATVLGTRPGPPLDAVVVESFS
jgi:hypothetical protein